MSEERLARVTGVGPVRRVELRKRLAAPVARVWDVITSVEDVKHWWPDWRPGGTIQKHEGGRVVLHDGSWINGSVQTWCPPHVFEFTWQDELENPSEVSWFEETTRSRLPIDLVAVGKSETQLTLVQYMPKGSAVGGAAGWHHFAGERLERYLEDGAVEDRPGRFDELEALYEGGQVRLDPSG